MKNQKKYILTEEQLFALLMQAFGSYADKNKIEHLMKLYPKYFEKEDITL